MNVIVTLIMDWKHNPSGKVEIGSFCDGTLGFFIFAYSCYNSNSSALRNNLNETYFHPSIKLYLNSLIFKAFFGWVNISIYVEKRSFIKTYNCIVLQYISTDSIPQVRPNYNCISKTVFFHIVTHIDIAYVE